MAEKMNGLMEKIYLKYIFDNPDQFEKVESYYFKNEDIRFVYSLVKEEYRISKVKIIPQPKQILAMVKLHADVREMSADTLKMILKTDNTDYSEEWLLPRYKSWKLSNSIRDNVMKSIEVIRNVDDSDYDNVKSIITQIKSLTNSIDVVDDDDDDLGSDFDDPLAHRQDATTQKISTGWGTLDTVLNGGWDYSSLVVFIGSTNIGKCCCGQTKIKVRNKYSGEIVILDIENFYNKLK